MRCSDAELSILIKENYDQLPFHWLNRNKTENMDRLTSRNDAIKREVRKEIDRRLELELNYNKHKDQSNIPSIDNQKN
jgi:hypothetical protein